MPNYSKQQKDYAQYRLDRALEDLHSQSEMLQTMMICLLPARARQKSK